MNINTIRSELQQVAVDALKYAKDMEIPSTETFVYTRSSINLSENKG